MRQFLTGQLLCSGPSGAYARPGTNGENGSPADVIIKLQAKNQKHPKKEFS